ncbi:MAG TPA: hypothetical protein VNN72_24640 [Polyangiaceae bacterium]|nr:hypothetical protein [Polyangiaceae bacterium]
MLQLDELGRMALAVLDGGLFVGTRLLELAAAYLERAADDGELDDTGEDGADLG